MIGALVGIAAMPVTNPMLLMVGGVGYRVAVPDRILQSVKSDATVTLYTHTHVREDTLDLYGFTTREELSLFELLLSVSGIGPKTALTVIDRGVGSIRRAIATADVSFFTSIPRLGKKNAQKIIIELKSKLGSHTDLDLQSDPSGETKDILDALTTMGFAKQEVMDAIQKLTPAAVTMEDKIRSALRLLHKG